MKTKLIWLLALMIGITITSCDKDDNNTPTNENEDNTSVIDGSDCEDDYTYTQVYQDNNEYNDDVYNALIPPCSYCDLHVFYSSDRSMYLAIGTNTNYIIGYYYNSIINRSVIGYISSTSCNDYLFIYDKDYNKDKSPQLLIATYKIVKTKDEIMLIPQTKGTAANVDMYFQTLTYSENNE